MVIAIDFDGTIVEHRYPEIGKLKPYAKKTINKLYEEGWIIIIWTCRYTDFDLNEMVEFLNDNEILYHHINENYYGLNSFNPEPKIYADIYIDDRNLFHIDDWNIIYDEIQRRII